MHDEHVNDDMPPSSDAAASLNDERRMHIRAYNRWAHAERIGEFPAWKAVLAKGRLDFGTQTIILDVMTDSGNPRIIAIGSRLRTESGIIGEIGSVSDVPRRSLLSRLTDQYFQVIANRAPVGFEAEFVDYAGRLFVYRAILLPCSSDGDTIDSIIGVINWRDHPVESVSAPAAEPLPHDQHEKGQAIMPKGTKKMSYQDRMQECLEIDGAVAVALVDLASGWRWQRLAIRAVSILTLPLPVTRT